MKRSIICVTFIFAILMSTISSDVKSQSKDTIKSADEHKSINHEIAMIQNRFGQGRIILTRRRVLKNTKIHEIHPSWIVYVKNGSLHDLMIEEIVRIEIGKEKQKIIVFDRDNKPIIY